MSTARHDAAYCEVPDCPPFMLVVFSESRQWAANEQFLPDLATKLLKILR
jgi:hypothetical protein